MAQIPTVYCIDTSTEMATYAQQVLHDEMERNRFPSNVKDLVRQHFHYQIADMKQFTLLQRENEKNSNNNNNNDDNNNVDTTTPVANTLVDTVWILLGSLQHLTTNEDVISCFQCIHDLLHETGSLFLELPHPRESTFTIMDCTRNGWKVPLQQEPSRDDNGTTRRSQFVDDDDSDEYEYDDDSDKVTDGGELSIVWGDEGDVFDPITQVRQFSIRFAPARLVWPSSILLLNF